MQALIGSNALIRSMAQDGRALLKTHTRRGVVYHLDGGLKPLPNEMVERLIGKGVLVPREASEQSFALSPEWGGAA